MPNSLEFKFLKDEPAAKDQPGFFEFYHKNFSPALKEIIENDSCVHTIGLFGRWGTGKSTIIDLLKTDLSYKLFLFDAWKYQDDALRRIFLIKFAEFLKKEGIQLPEGILDPLYMASETSSELKPKKEKETWWNWIKRGLKQKWLPIFMALAFIALVLLQYFNDALPSLGTFKGILQSILSLSLVALFFKPTFEKILQESVARLFKSVLPWTQVRTIVEKEDRLNSPEQFEDLFNKIIGKVDEKVVIVFDNVDRVQGDTAIKILATIKTFLDPLRNSNVIFIVPCDSVAIIQQIKAFYETDDEVFDHSEYLRKLFNVVIYTPEFIDTDLELYTRHLISQTRNIGSLMDDDVVFVITKAFSSNPREIKQFINNLISFILVASKSEVKDIIVQPGKIAYLAKVLVLKQKYPQAYLRLKERWYEPDKIGDDEPDPDKPQYPGLASFLTSTSPISTDDAEPYIYLKKPAIAGNIANAVQIRQQLLTGDASTFEESMALEANKGDLVDYVLLLLKRYQNQHDPLLNIFVTQLAVFANKIEITKRNYFDESLKIISSKLWEDFLKLPTDLIFSFLLDNKTIEISLRNDVIERYTLLFENKIVKQPANQEFLISLIHNFLSYRHFFNTEQQQKISQAIEGNFSTNIPVLQSFKDLEIQERHVTPQTIRDFIESISSAAIENAEPIITLYKDYILKHKLAQVVLVKIQQWLSAETGASGDYRPEKDALVKVITRLLSFFKENIKELSVEDRQEFGRTFVQAFSSISDWDNKGIFLVPLRRISHSFEEAQKNELESLIKQFLQKASPERIKSLLTSNWNPEFIASFLNENLPEVLNRTTADDAFLKAIYKISDKPLQLRLIKHVIKNRPNQGMDFVRSLEGELPDRGEVVQYLLEKAATLSAQERVEIYMYVNKNLNKNDSTAIKDLAVVQIKELLKVGGIENQKIGYEFLAQGDYLSEERKREIAKEVLETLRVPGTNLDENNRYALMAVNLLFSTLQETLQKDYVYSVFDAIRQEKTPAGITLLLEIITSIAPSYLDFEKDYSDLLGRLESWPDDANKPLVLSKILELKPPKVTGKEKDFWERIAQLLKGEPEETDITE